MFGLDKLKRCKQGQITIFIIIGIIAVISVGMVLYLQSSGVIDVGRGARPYVEEVPVQARPVSDYVEGCLEQVALDGLRRIGDHGGYIDWKSIPGVSVNPAEPTDSNAIAFFTGSEMVLPYWWFMNSQNDCEKGGSCTFDSKRPPLYRSQGAMSIEGQLDEYIDENLVECLRGFEVFKQQKFEVTELSPPKTKTSVTDQAVVFELEYPLDVSKGNLRHRMMHYFIEVPLNLKEIYEVGWEIIELQSEHSIFEKYTQHLISLYGSVDKDALPPIAGFELSYSGATEWSKPVVLERLKTIIMSTTPLVQVVGTRNFMIPDVSDDTAYADTVRSLYVIHSMMDLEEEHRGIEVNFNYFPQWKPYFDLNCVGDTCKAESASFDILEEAFGINRYNFVYDISYPVFVDITNPDAFKGQGYSFKFFIEANIRNNLPITMTAPPVPPRRSAESLLCSDLQAIADVEVTVADAKELNVMDNVEVTFKCGLDSCPLGKTKDGVVKGKIPKCIGGMLYANTKGYQARWSPVDVLDDTKVERTIHLEPYREIDFIGRRYLFRKVPDVGWKFFPQPDTMKRSENMVVVLQKKQGVGEVTYVASADILGGNDPGQNSRNVRMVPGVYDVMVSVLDRAQLYIPGDNPMAFNNTNPFMAGGVHIGTWTLTKDMLDNAAAIQFNAYVYDLVGIIPESSRSIDDVGLSANLDGNTQQYLNVLKPKIIYKS